MTCSSRAAETVLVLDHGHLVEQGPPAQVLDAPRHEATRRLLAPARARGTLRSIQSETSKRESEPKRIGPVAY